MIERINEQVAYNPVREHINISFETVTDKDQQIERIAGDIIKQGFEPVLSRVLVFVRTRKAAEEVVEELKECLGKKKVAWAEKIGFFHAGMDSIDRESSYDDFQDGKKVILVATKAFGMGMDIPNIHYVYHLGPSSTFEDFLQEVGRAGRNKEKLEKAGFSTDKPIRTKCVLTKDEFRYLQDLNHKSAISWNDVKAVRKVVFDFIGKFQRVVADPLKPFPLPFDLLYSYPEFEEEFDKDGLFRLSLYWLERLKRIRLGLFTPAFLPIKIREEGIDYSNIQDLEERSAVTAFINSIKAYKAGKFPEKDSVVVPMAEIRRYSGKHNHSEVFRFLFLAQKTKAISIDRYITLEPTELRSEELENFSLYNFGPTIEATFALAEKILNRTKLGEQVSFSGSFLDSLILETADEYFLPNKIFWKEFKKKSKEEIPRKEIVEKLKKDFVTKRVKFAFKLIAMLPNMSHKSIIEANVGRKKGEVVNLIYNGYKNNEQWLKLFESFKKDSIRLITKITSNYRMSGKRSVNYADLIIQLELEDKGNDYLPNIIFISKALGYLKGSGSFVPMGIELFIDDVSEINEKDSTSHDFQVFQEFQEGIRLKELRLLALECLSTLSSFQKDAFIKSYFTCANSSELINLLEEYFGEDHPILGVIRREALSREEAKLNEQQKQVYVSPADDNLQVIAGPGSGKTHTLTLRVARLIQNEQVNPEQILILAYNRAVVVELKGRLTKLFKELGYSKLISRLKVFTFHGFCKFCLESELDGVEFDLWVPSFLDKFKKNPGRINQKLGSIKYVFVDEFQDVTNSRLELLQKIANPERTNICVIGDPNQSIYGYDRVNEGGKMSPKPYYEKFAKIYNPKELNLNINYRSLPDIINAAEDLLNKNTPEFNFPKLVANRLPESYATCCEIINWKEVKVDWREKLKLILNEEYASGKKYQQVAVMYRSNEEVFRAFNEIQSLGLIGVRTRIQGSSSSPFKSREFFHFIQIFKGKSAETLSSTFIEDFEAEKRNILTRFSNWDSYLVNLLHCILKEFQVEMGDESTYQDLIDFVQDLTGRDEGHYAKIFEKHIHDISKDSVVREIVLTTMHKVKGVEFDAVIIPPSFSDFPLKEEPDPSKLQELVEEERRLLYVAYTRARYKLVVLKYDRELAIDAGVPFKFSNNVKHSLGVVVKQGYEKFYISYGGTDNGNFLFDFIRNIKIGQKLNLIKPKKFWFLEIQGKRIGCLSEEVTNQLDIYAKGGDFISGFSVASIDILSYDDTVEYDKPKPNKKPSKKATDFAKHWCEQAKNRGYIYLVEFSGYGK